MRRQTLALAGASAAVALAGCAHNDVLVFGTHTQLALDVQSASVQGGSPSITVGYKRTEAVWMPLVVNGRDSSVVGPCTKGQAFGKCRARAGDEWAPEAAKYQSREVIEPTDGKPKVTRSDAYSVFASLGATFNTSAGSSDQAQGGIAQFFATGNAATSIAENPALVTALKLESGEGARAQSAAVAAVAGNKTAASLLAGASPEDVASREAEATKQVALHERRVALVLACATAPDGSYRWTQIIDKTDYDGDDKALYKQIQKGDLEDRLRMNPALTKKTLAVGVDNFTCTGE